MFSKLLRYLISPTLLICLIGSNCYSSEQAYEDLKKNYPKNERTPLIEHESDEKFNKKPSIKKKTNEFTIKNPKGKIKDGILTIELRQIKTRNIKKIGEYVFKNRFITSLILTTNDHYDCKKYAAKDKSKLLEIIKDDRCISNLSLSLPYFDIECAEEISKQGLVTGLTITKNSNLKSEDNFYQALAKNPRLSKLNLIGFSDMDLLKVFSDHPSLKSLNTSYKAITYDQAKLFLAISKLENLTITMKDLTAEQEKKLIKRAKSHKSGKVNLDLDKIYSVTN